MRAEEPALKMGHAEVCLVKADTDSLASNSRPQYIPVSHNLYKTEHLLQDISKTVVSTLGINPYKATIMGGRGVLHLSLIPLINTMAHIY